MASIYLIEDNFTHLTYIKKKLREYISNLHQTYIVNEIVSIDKFYNEISASTILDNDIFFIDIQLNKYFNGIDLAKKLRANNENCLIIFLTAEESKGLEIINENIIPFGYIVKDPNKMEQIDEQLNRIMRQINYKISHQKETIIVKNFDKNLFIFLTEINYFSTIKDNRHYSYLQTYEKEYILNESFVNIKKNIFPDYYIVTLKSYIINTHQIKLIERRLGKLIFKNNKELYLSPLLIGKILKKIKNL
ncbi:hypothetical protein BH747_09945 [Enterococcus villorum]|uniref:Response regulatory domain-containing protein n=1 Tax=Enterococcus villorum TaxID=112904 RepID=A0A1V8YAJ0_9ENTE|nr:LytTR family transcriptional regulator DNA-binding domain-containing protein [Enterococcus villorum]OQO69582.1 hypothetical protein BH747_09945 [Enterococcus villorum]OQO72666.1 hypothetical protein BH744_11155 [Enterococcus villorum]